MFLKGLKFNILIHLGIIIAVAMLLVDLVLIITFGKILTSRLVDQGNLLSSAVQAAMAQPVSSTTFGRRMTALSRKAGVSCMVVTDGNHRPLFSTPHRCSEKTEVDALVRRAIRANRNTLQFSGTTWGVFWRQQKYLTLATPLHQGATIVGGAGMVFDLDRQYASLRQIQKLMWSYMLINLTALAFIGLYQISKVAINPLKRILNRAETYREDEPVFFRDDVKTNEFNRLSTALNRMLLRISDDRERLKATIASLEAANRELTLAQAEMIRYEKAATVGRLSSGIAHEIGNPLGIILGYLDLLKPDSLTAREKQDILDRVEKEIRRINTIIRQLLDFSRPGMEVSESVSVHRVISDLVEMAVVLPMMRDIELTVSLDASPDTVLGEEGTLKQVLLNLLINAADAVSAARTPGDGKIHIETHNTRIPDGSGGAHLPGMAIIFEDNGEGIAQKDLGSIFEPFFTTKDPERGTGLGLWVSHMMIENMGGTIDVSSKIAEGTRLVVHFPLHIGKEELT